MKKAVVGVENRFMSDERCTHCFIQSDTYTVVCANGHIQPFYTINPFIIFQLTPTLNIDKVKLDQQYFAFQRMLHPDKLRQVSNELQQWAEQHIGQINHAYKALQDVVQIAKATALYIQDPTLSLEKFNDQHIPMLDVDFLTTIMALQTKGTAEDIDKMYCQITAELDVSVHELDLQRVLNAIARLTYVERLRKLIQEN